jgi:hypothetical protein
MVQVKSRGNNVLIDNKIKMHFREWNSLKADCNGIENIVSVSQIAQGVRAVTKDGKIIEHYTL